MDRIDIPTNLLDGWDIVVVDDEPDSLEVAEIILDAYGANVHTGTNGAEGLEQVRAIRPLFVISDISMPVMDGWPVSRRKPASPTTEATYISS